jgi:DNA-directed RNA polymerase specialized sigma24 family protein
MNRKTLYVEQEVECEYDIEFDDILELIENCDEDEIKQIREVIGHHHHRDVIVSKNLADEQKSELLAAAFKKYSYEELQERLDIKMYEIY